MRFQLLATLGSLDTPAAQAAQERLLLAGLEDEWLQVAALSASSDRAMAYLASALRPGSPFTAAESAGRSRFFDRLGGVVAARQQPDELARAIAAATDRDDCSVFHRLMDVLEKPYQYRPELALYATPPRPEEVVRQTFCGT